MCSFLVQSKCAVICYNICASQKSNRIYDRHKLIIGAAYRVFSRALICVQYVPAAIVVVDPTVVVEVVTVVGVDDVVAVVPVLVATAVDAVVAVLGYD